MKLIKQVESLTNEYVRKGGKDNRTQQRNRMLDFAALASSLGAQDMGQVGAMHVVRYWKAHRHLEDSTLKQHWHALKVLWRLSKKTGFPPEPWKKKPVEAALSFKEKLFGRGDGG